MNDGRTVSFADYGTPDQTAVVWCHGGPGSRFEPEFCARSAVRAGLRLIAIDRPGYGRSTPKPGRTIGAWIPDALAVVDHLGIDRFVSVGVSTGGAYALALASRSPRVTSAVACCALTDMRWAEGRAMVPQAGGHHVSDDRPAREQRPHRASRPCPSHRGDRSRRHTACHRRSRPLQRDCPRGRHCHPGADAACISHYERQLTTVTFISYSETNVTR